jgi:hypothetical protein
MRFSLGTNLTVVVAVAVANSSTTARGAADEAPPLGPPGMQATYRLESGGTLRSNSVERFTLNLGAIEQSGDARCQWLALQATKVNSQRFAVWILGRAFPPRTLEQAAATTARYLVQEGDDPPQEFTHRFTGAPVLPSLGAWEFLWPRPEQGDFRDGIVASHVT